jgi:hypothetical protein
MNALSFPTRFLTTLAAAGLLTLSVNACSKKKEATPEKAPAPSASAVDPNADGKRLERAINDWKRRWERIDLEKCDALLKEPADLEACKKAEDALAKVKEFAAKLDKSPAALTAAGELILASEAVVEKLRAANILATAAGAPSGKPGAAPAPAAPKTVASVAKAKVAPKGSGPAAAVASGAPVRKEDPATKLVSSYERTARSAARYLGSFLQQGTLDVRKQAFGEVQRLVPLREKWLTLRDVVRQASLTERDADLKKQLRDLEQKLRGSAPPPPAAVSGLRPAAPPPAGGPKPAGHDDHEH